MLHDSRYIAEAYTTQIGTSPIAARPALQATPTAPVANANFSKPASLPSQNNQEEVKKETHSVKDWIRLPFIDTPFKAKMAAVLIVELIYNLTKNQEMRELVLKEIKTNNRLQKRH